MKNYYLGVDVSKGYADFIVLNECKQVEVCNFQLDDSFKGHQSLFFMLAKFLQSNDGSHLFAAVESTGGYENNWYRSLLRFSNLLKISVARLNPYGVTASREAGLSRNVTDKMSAKTIAEYMIRHPEKVSYQNQDELSGLQKQWSFLNMVKKQVGQLTNQLESLVYCANPELLMYCKDGFPQWVLRLLKCYPTAKRLSRAKISSIARIPYITLKRAKELRDNAKYSVASSNDKATEQVIEATVNQCIHLTKVIDSQTRLLVENCNIPEVELLTTFHGLGVLSAIGLMLEIQTIKRFPSVKKISSYFGIHPVYKQSGDGLSGYKMSKRGRKEPRKILFMVTLSAIRSNPLIKEIYAHRVKEGMNKMAVIGLCMHKILRIIYGMLKRNMAFDAEIDRANQKKFKSQAGDNRIATIRRVQGFDTKAPISKRQDKKRKEQRESQGVNAPSAGSSPPFLQIDNMTMNADYKQNIR